MPFDPVAARQAPGSAAVPRGVLSTSQLATAFGVSKATLNLPIAPTGGAKKTKATDTARTYLYALNRTSGPQEVQRIQELLYAGHFYSASYYGKTTAHSPTYGNPDADTNAAYAKALRQASATNQPVEDVLSRVGALTGMSSSGSTYSAITGTDIAATANATALQRYGRHLTPTELDKLVKGFNAIAPTDPNLSPSEYAYTALQQNNPTEVLGQDTRNTMDEFFSALGPAIHTGNNG